MEHFSARKLREARASAGVRTYQLGAVVGVARCTINRWEDGSQVPKTQVLGPLARAVGVRVGDLFEDVDE